MITELSLESHKILKRWAKAQYYIYIRPLSSLFMDPHKKHRLYWTVTVEFRTFNWQRWGCEGYDLDEAIKKLDAIVPRRDTKNLKYHPKDWNGAYAPGEVQRAEQRKAAKKARGRR